MEDSGLTLPMLQCSWLGGLYLWLRQAGDRNLISTDASHLLYQLYSYSKHCRYVATYLPHIFVLLVFRSNNRK